VTPGLEKYFHSFNFYSLYDDKIFPDEGLTSVPALSVLLPVAWITGADISVDCLDRRFKLAADELQKRYRQVYPRAPFQTDIIAHRLTDSPSKPAGSALLFSGGLDSTYSLFHNISARPGLVLVLGTDVDNSSPAHQDYVQKTYARFAEQEGLPFHAVRTSGLDLLNQERLNHFFAKYSGKHQAGYWNGIGYALGHMGQAAPLSTGRFDRLLFAASYWHEYTDPLEHPDASSPLTDEAISWANVHVEHDGPTDRQEKIRRLKNEFLNHRIQLRVCWARGELLSSPDQLNCNRCEKCLRTIASLLQAHIDPNICGFRVDASTMEVMRFLFKKRLLPQKSLSVWWKPIQKNIPDQISYDLHGSRSFFEWFKKVRLESRARKFLPTLFGLYKFFPYGISHLAKKTFYDRRQGFKIYEPIRLPDKPGDRGKP
jgi:hypothetical protein